MPNHRSLPPLNALRAFEAAGRKLSFRAAADELQLPQLGRGGARHQQVQQQRDDPAGVSDPGQAARWRGHL